MSSFGETYPVPTLNVGGEDLFPRDVMYLSIVRALAFLAQIKTSVSAINPFDVPQA